MTTTGALAVIRFSARAGGCVAWSLWEQYNHEPNIATLRFWHGWVGAANLTELQRAQIPVKRAGGEAALALMEEHLAGRTFLVGDRLSLADIVLYAYTHVADGGGFDLEPYPAVGSWLARVAATPGHIAFTD